MSKSHPTDIDPQETTEWLDALSAVIQQEGHERAHFLIHSFIDSSRRSGVTNTYHANTAYLKTITVNKEQQTPGDHAIEPINRYIIS